MNESAHILIIDFVFKLLFKWQSLADCGFFIFSFICQLNPNKSWRHLKISYWIVSESHGHCSQFSNTMQMQIFNQLVKKIIERFNENSAVHSKWILHLTKNLNALKKCCHATLLCFYKGRVQNFSKTCSFTSLPISKAINVSITTVQ